MNTKVLYRFKVNQETGEISRESITDYSFVENKHFSSGYKEQSYYRHKVKGAWHYAYMCDFDRYVNQRVYSWDSDINHAKEVICKALEDSYERLSAQAQRASQLREKIAENH